MRTEKLVMMVNQIAAFFAIQGRERAIPQIAKHVENFWDPRMRAAIATHIANGGAGLDPLALAALMTLEDISATTA